MRHPRLQASSGLQQHRSAHVLQNGHQAICSLLCRGPNGVWTCQRAGKPLPKLHTSFVYANPSLTHQVSHLPCEQAVTTKLVNLYEDYRWHACQPPIHVNKKASQRMRLWHQADGASSMHHQHTSHSAPACTAGSAGPDAIRQAAIHLQPERGQPARALGCAPQPAGGAARQLLR
jgi:hypothetical protein